MPFLNISANDTTVMEAWMFPHSQTRPLADLTSITRTPNEDFEAAIALLRAFEQGTPPGEHHVMAIFDSLPQPLVAKIMQGSERQRLWVDNVFEALYLQRTAQ